MWPALPALAAPLLLTVGMLGGWFTPTEVASVTVAYTLFIGVVYYKKLTLEGLRLAAFETIRATSGILLIVSIAALFGWILSVEQIPQQITAALEAVSQISK